MNVGLLKEVYSINSATLCLRVSVRMSICCKWSDNPQSLAKERYFNRSFQQFRTVYEIKSKSRETWTCALEVQSFSFKKEEASEVMQTLNA